MPVHKLRLDIESPILSRLIFEQLDVMKNIKIDDGSNPDCIITQVSGNYSLSSKPYILNIPSKGTVRLGEIIDRLGYALSGRENHIEGDDIHIDLGYFILRLSENSMLHKETGDVIQLTDKERMLLRYLYQSGKEGILRKDLLKSVWGYAEEAETHTLETHIYRLRQKLEKYDVAHFIKVEDGRYIMINKS